MSKKKLVKSLIIGVLLIAIVVTLCVLFIPKSMKSLVPSENIEKITYTKLGVEEYDLNDQQVDEFFDLIKSSKYNKRIILLRCANSWVYTIMYKDGSYIEIGDFLYAKYKGSHDKIFQYKLYGKITELSIMCD